tara:strand:+ start:385 stop:849 length:465 start_codon:yes stop_codon:yes gene_type:complete
MSDDTEVRIVNLINGLSLVGETVFDEYDSVTLKFPLEIGTKTIRNADGSVIGENMILKPYLVMTDDVEMEVDSFQIVSTHRLAERLLKSYYDMVDTAYKDEIHMEGSFLDKQDEEDKAVDSLPDDKKKKLKEYVDNLLENLEASGPDKDNKKLH